MRSRAPVLFSIALVSLVCVGLAGAQVAPPIKPISPTAPIAPKVAALPAGIAKSQAKLPPVSNLGASTSSPTAAALFRTQYGVNRCALGQVCTLIGKELGTHRPGSALPTGMRLTRQDTFDLAQPFDVPVTSWTRSAIRFSVPPKGVAPGKYYVAVRTAANKRVSNLLEIELVSVPSDVRDFDQDGADAISKGGTDCDDLNPNSYPGRTEVYDLKDIDEDCDPSTFGMLDTDGDGYASAYACNVTSVGTAPDVKAEWTCGGDCRDARFSIKPGEMFCADANVILICPPAGSRGTKWPEDSRFLPSSYEKYDCPSLGSGYKCVTQPNHLGVCQHP